MEPGKKEIKNIMVASQPGGRFVISTKDGEILDDAQGYGYKSYQSATKAMWYKFGGGKQKTDSKEAQYKKWEKANEKIARYIDRSFENNYKELSRGEFTNEDIIKVVEKEFSIELPDFIKKCFSK